MYVLLQSFKDEYNVLRSYVLNNMYIACVVVTQSALTLKTKRTVSKVFALDGISNGPILFSTHAYIRLIPVGITRF